MKLLCFFLTAACLIVSNSAFSQYTTETVSKTFKITNLYKEANNPRDSCLVYFPAAKNVRVEPGATGIVYTKSKSDNYGLEIGTGFVINSDSDYIRVYVISSKEALTDSNYMVKVGDLITLWVKVPYKPRKSIFYDLDLLGIHFYNRTTDDAIWNFNTTANRDSKQYSDSLVAECIKELQRSYAANKQKTDLQPVYNQPIAEGRNKGKSIMDVYKEPRPNDILPFLTYIKENKWDFRGKQCYLDYGMALWLYAKSPYSSIEMLDTLLSYNVTSKKFNEFVQELKKQILADDFVDKWSFVAMDKQSDGQERTADSILRVTGATTRIIKDSFGLAMHFLGETQILQYRLKYKEALATCDSSLKYLSPISHGHFTVELCIKKGFLYQKLKMLPQAITAFNMAVNFAKDTTAYLDGYTKEAVLGRVYERQANCFSSFEEYPRAIESYKNAIQWYMADGSYKSMNNAADAQELLGDLYKKQGAYADAMELYVAVKRTYAKLSDVKNKAKFDGKIGDIQFQQGKYVESIESQLSAMTVYQSLKLYSDEAYCRSFIGQAYWNLGKYDSAIYQHNKAIEKAKLANDHSREAYSWSKLGSLFSLVGDKNKALIAYDSSLYYYEAAGDSSGLLSNLYDVGKVYENDGQFQKAYGYYMKAHKLNQQTGSRSEMTNSFFKLGYAANNFDTALARQNYEMCYNLAKEIGDKSNTLYASLNLGILATRTYKYQLANKYFKEGLNLAIEQQSKSDEAWAYARIADGEGQKSNYDSSIFLYKKAMHIYDSIGDKSQSAWLYSSIGYAVQNKGDFAGSIQYFDKMKELGVELKNPIYVAAALNSTSFIYSLFGEHKKALQCADSALKIFTGLKNNWQIANTYLKLGDVYGGMGEFHKAITSYLVSDSMFTAEKDDLSRSTTQNNMGVVYFFQADYDKSLTYFMEADRISQLQNTLNESAVVTRQNIGEIYLAKKNYDLAKKYLMEVYKVSKEKDLKRSIGGSALLLGKVAFENNKLQEALSYFKEAKTNCLITNESDRVIEANLFLGKTYYLLKDPQAINFLNTAATLAKKTGSKYTWQVLYELGINYYNQDNFDSASVYFKQAVTDIEETATKLFGGSEAKKVYAADERKVDVYNKIVASLAKLKRTDEALFYADKSNSQAIKEKLEQSGIVTADKDKGEALKKGNELLQKQTAIEQAIAKEKAKPEKERNSQLIASLEGIKKVAEEDYLNFINQLVEKYPDLNSYFSKTDPSQFRNYIDLIPDSTIVILYVINDKQLFIFTVTNQETGIKVVDLPEDINAQATRFLSILKNPENATGTGAITVRATIRDKNLVKGDFKKDATTLYSLLITPIEDQLKDKKTLCIIPNSRLSSIPFSSLGYVDQANEFHFLIENYRLFYTNKIEIFSKPYKPQDIEKSFVVFGNPDKSLPGATKEAKNIAEIFPTATIYLEENATEEKAKDAIKNFGFVHFATHGILDGEDFSKSYLLFNADGANDGKLSIAEVNGLIKKETSLVFLSACDMAVSRETVKGWYISPINAFLNNRVTTGVGPLWQVPDEATQLLLTEFYKNIKYLKMTKADALRYAQATLSKNPKYAHPYFWAAFVLYGEWR
jgi:CHAT domain-containing protein/tetratricopeptide (TPR) repeat protein